MHRKTLTRAIPSNHKRLSAMLSRLRSTWQTIKYWPHYLWASYRFSGYKPQPVTVASVTKWLNQFDDKDRKIILQLMKKVSYISEKETETWLLRLNNSLLERLSAVNIPIKNIIYVQIHDPGSSSAVILNMLRDRGRLERKGCYFIDSKNVRELHEVTESLEQGAIVYVDDFAATGRQFCQVRDYLAEYIVGNFSEFFLLPSICEEALYELGRRGVEAVAEKLHSKAERPLHQNSSILAKATKNRLIELCQMIDKKGALGYRGLATMVVFYRNAPNTTPVILRGCVRQRPFVGIFPRATDLP